MLLVCVSCGVALPDMTTAKGILLCTDCRNKVLHEEIATKIGDDEKNVHYDEQWEYPSRSNKPSLIYKVSRRGNDFQCSCPAWKFRRAECSHIKDVRQTLTLQGIQQSTTAPTNQVRRRRFRLPDQNNT